MTPDELKAATDAGHVARVNGLPRKANPYYLDTPLARAWFAGYDGPQPSLPNRIATWLLAVFKKVEHE